MRADIAGVAHRERLARCTMSDVRTYRPYCSHLLSVNRVENVTDGLRKGVKDVLGCLKNGTERAEEVVSDRFGRPTR